MKKFLLFFAVTAVAMAGCETGNEADRGAQTGTQTESGSQPAPKPEPDSQPDPNTYVAEYYKLINQTKSDVVIEFHSGEVMTIKPGEEREIQKWDIVYKPGIAYAVSMYVVDLAVMTVGGKVLPDSVWLFEYWNEIRDDGEDDHHYTLIYTLTVTDELVKKLRDIM